MNDSDAKLKKLIVVGDRVLIKPKKISNKTKAGLFLPPGYQEKEEIQTGFVVKIGPGYPIPLPSDEFNETWKKNEEKISISRFRLRKEIWQFSCKKEPLK